MALGRRAGPLASTRREFLDQVRALDVAGNVIGTNRELVRGVASFDARKMASVRIRKFLPALQCS
jgi:hypothetical protein